MLAILDTAVVSGIRGELVRVEVDVAPGLPGCQIVGLPDTALSEARQRVRSAIRNAGFSYPLSRITVNLAPAHRRKHGAAYDVAIAIGILLAASELRSAGGPWALLGELSLDGTVMAVPGVLPMVSTLHDVGHGRVCVPVQNVAEAAMVSGVEVVGVEGLDDVARLIAGPKGRRAAAARRHRAIRIAGSAAMSGASAASTSPEAPDLAEVRGQAVARWALEVAVAGRHNLLLVGSPGAGKTLLARTTPGLQPPLESDEVRDVAVIRSVAGDDSSTGTPAQRPFLAPHHSASYAAMVGGGPRLSPGLVTRAHLGALFLDELAEFDRDVLDALRQPLEDGSVELARAHGSVRYPARVQLIAAMNPCRCGWYGDPARACRCPAHEPERYVRRISGPLLDRIDLRVAMPRMAPDELVGPSDTEDSKTVAVRIHGAQQRARGRNGGTVNASLRGQELIAACQLERSARDTLTDVSTALALTGRSVHRLMRVARTIADLRVGERVSADDILAASSLRLEGMEEGTR